MQFAQVEDTGRIVDPQVSAAAVGLHYVSADGEGIRRKRAGKGFTYVDARGARITDKATLDRIHKLVLPPAWEDVWICPDPNGHLQATGIDARGRKQYRYNDEFRRHRETAKFEHILVFAQALPAIRERVAADMARKGLPREKVLATIVHLLETTLVRVGNADYAKANGSYGLTTLRNPHVDVAGSALRFHFKGKSGKEWNLQVQDRRVAKVVRACQELPGQQLFEYRDDDGQVRRVDSTDVNAYLKEITGRDITAKDFRTWFGTVAAAIALHERGVGESATASKRTTREVIAQVSARLGNTPTICRKCYVHPEVLACYAGGELVLRVRQGTKKHALSPEESAVYRFLVGRLG
ncbi:MAG: DNA topoisomerase IB [Alphaproteobacteria bacterium]|nr:DNA topoisomerase IB [Alphaproteobacteria bacterium]